MRFAKPHAQRGSRASRRSRALLPRCMRSLPRGTRTRSRSRSGSKWRWSVSEPRRELLRVAGAEPIGPYTLLRLERGGVDPGAPGQFFMLEAPGRLLPRALSLCLAPAGELAFLVDPVGPGTAALCALGRHDAIHVLGPLGHGFGLDVERPLLVGGGVGIAPLPYLAEALRFPPAVLGFRSEHHAEAAALLPGAEIAIDPTLVTELIPTGHEVLACGPEPMLEAVAAQCPG